MRKIHPIFLYLANFKFLGYSLQLTQITGNSTLLIMAQQITPRLLHVSTVLFFSQCSEQSLAQDSFCGLADISCTLVAISGWVPLPKCEFPSSSAKKSKIPATLEREPLEKQTLQSSGQLQYGKNNPCKKTSPCVVKKPMRDEREKFRKLPVYQPSRSRVQFNTMKCMFQTLSKAAQDQSEDKPLPVALMLTQG